MRYHILLVLVFLALLGAFLWSRAASRHAPSVPAASGAPSAPLLPASFTDVAPQAGLAFRYENNRKGIATILEEAGSGCAIFDYDGDGWPDLYLLNGRDLYGRGIQGRNVLYHNNGDGTFTDVTDKAGVPGTEFGGQFHTGCAWFDYDRDGKLDLFLCSYVKFKQEGLRYCKLPDGVLSNCPPQMYDGTPSLLYHNNGDGTFTNVTRKAGLYVPPMTNGKALSVITCDVNEDGWPDLIVGNDGEEAWLLRNNRNGTFTNIAAASGIAFAQDGATMAAMGIDLGDYRNEGKPGFFVADFSKRPDHLWRNLGNGFFQEVSTPAKIADPTFPTLGFGAGFFDYDNDGWLDIFVANGHVYPEVEQGTSGEHYLQNNQLFHNERDGTFRETTQQAGPAFQLKHAGRGAAFGDLDNDGNMDILVNNNDGPPVLLHNSGYPGRHFVSFLLIGTRSNRDAIGAQMTLTAGGLKQLREVRNGGSYLSCNDPRLHFGLGAATTVEKITVLWPSGLRQQFGPLPADGFYVLREGASQPEPQTFRPPRREAKP